MTMWVVGKVIDYSAKSWEMIGVFDTKAQALRECRAPLYFLGPIELNRAMPDQTIEWEGAYYPVNPADV